jgi:hypothetical protein
VYRAPTQVESSELILANLRDQIKPEEKARFDRQVEAQNQKLITIGQGHLKLQALPIGLPDAVPTRQYPKKKTHGLSDARGLTGAEIAARELKAREALARNKRVITPEDEIEGTLFKTPPSSLGSRKVGLLLY